MSTPARFAQISSADERRFAFALEEIGQLPYRSRLAGAVDADDQRHLRRLGDRDRSIDRGKHVADFLLHELAQALSVRRSRLHGADDAVGRCDTDVGRNQHLFERVHRVRVHRARPSCRLVGNPDDFIEALDDLLLGTGKTVAEAAEKAHSVHLTLRAPRAGAGA
jgi:hypothetical protein